MGWESGDSKILLRAAAVLIPLAFAATTTLGVVFGGLAIILLGLALIIVLLVCELTQSTPPQPLRWIEGAHQKHLSGDSLGKGAARDTVKGVAPRRTATKGSTSSSKADGLTFPLERDLDMSLKNTYRKHRAKQ